MLDDFVETVSLAFTLGVFLCFVFFGKHIFPLLLLISFVIKTSHDVVYDFFSYGTLPKFVHSRNVLNN